MDHDSDDGLFVPDSSPPAPRRQPQHNGHRRRRSQNHHTHQQHHRPYQPQPPRQRQSTTAATVIDLTAEPDSPDSPVEVQIFEQPPSQQTSQSQGQGRSNPRRTNSQRISPPTLSRSDGTVTQPDPGNVIDLTIDSPEHDLPSRYPPARPDLRLPYPHNYPRSLRNTHGDTLTSVGIAGSSRSQHFRRLLGMFSGATPVAIPFLSWGSASPLPVDADLDGAYIAADGPRITVPDSGRSCPIPPMEPTPPTRRNFTRNTCAEPEGDMIIVCPNCSEELAYDPLSLSGPSGSGRGTKRKRTTASDTHPFWALKSCGHVRFPHLLTPFPRLLLK